MYNKTKKYEVAKRYRERNAQHLREYKKRWHKENSERIIAKVKLWNEEHPEQTRKTKRRWIEENPEKNKESQRRWLTLYPEKRKDVSRQSGQKRRALLKDVFVEDVDPRIVFERDKGTCQICKCPVEDDFHIDHIIPVSKGGEHSYVNVQLAHPSCNLKKHAKMPERLECPIA